MKKYRRVISHDTGEWCKVWRKLALDCKHYTKKFVYFNASSGKFENLHFDVLPLSIAYKFSAKKVKQLWRKTNFLFEKWHEKFDEF